jgi:hypothetical protein
MTLEGRLLAVLQLIGLDIKALQTASPGGGAVWKRATLNVPAGPARFESINVAAPAVTLASVIPCQLIGGVASAVNDAEEVANWTITATPLNGSINFNIACPGPFVGPVEILYKVQ